MSGQSFKLEEIFQEAFEKYQVHPSKKTLVRLKRKLWARDFMSFKPTRINIYYVLLLMGGLTSVYLMTGDPVISVDEEMTESPVIRKEKKIETERPDEALKQKKNTRQVDVVEEKEAEPADPDATLPLPEAGFAVSGMSGCAPLKVKFNNLSSHAASYQWNLGDGTEVTTANPVHVYNEPGTYRVRLKVVSDDEQTDEYAEQITVYESPDAAFSVDESASSNQERTVQFVNQSEHAVEFLWLFGDGAISRSKEPGHTYDQYKSYQVTLIATSASGCKDTTQLVTTFLKEQYGLSFPKNFVPNPQGPGNNGYYKRYDWPESIFYPRYNGVQEYILTIETPGGIEVFNTKQIEQGWNGYIRGRLAPAGQYNWRAEGIYENGEPFSLGGHVIVKHEGIRDTYGY